MRDRIHATLNGMEECLLDVGGVLLKPEHVYVEPELFQTGLYLILNVQDDFQGKLSRLLQYILKRINHKDRGGVVLIYGLYQESLKEDYRMGDLLGLITSERRKGKKRELLSESEGDCMKKKELQETGHWGKGLREKGQGKEQGKEQGNEQSRNHITGKWKGKSGETEKEHNSDRGEKRGRKEKGRLGRYKTKREGSDQTGPKQKRTTLGRQFTAWLSTAVLYPSTLWMFRGVTMVIDSWRLLTVIDEGLLFILSAVNLYRLFTGHRVTKADGADSDDRQDPWRILYEDEDDENEDLGDRPSTTYTNKGRGEYLQEMPESSIGECLRTVLLSERPAQREGVRRLSALNGSDEDIVISYYPFVIGEYKDLADYVLLKDTVSRFHIRLGGDNGSYIVMDPNSTNSTKVKGRLLETNKTMQLEPRNQIFTADCRYIFY